MKIFFLNFIIVLFVFSGYVFSFMQDKVFCTISSDSITVTIDRQNNYKCKEYTTVISQAINKEYHNVLKIQNLINQGYDTEFWTNIRETKRKQIKRMILIKNQIEESVLDFEENLFEKTKEYIIYITTPYKNKYKRFLKPLKDLQDISRLKSSIRGKIYLMQQQLEVIGKIELVENYSSLVEYLDRYLYLKNQIEGK